MIGLGYSNGANILASVMFENPDIFDEVVLMHPLIPWTPAGNPALARVRALITAGRRDPICPSAQTEALTDYLRKQGARVDIAWHEGGHEIRPSEIDAAAKAFGARGPEPDPFRRKH